MGDGWLDLHLTGALKVNGTTVIDVANRQLLNGDWDVAGDVLPVDDVTHSFGSPTLTWLDINVENVKDNAGTVILETSNGSEPEFPTNVRFGGTVGIGTSPGSRILDMVGSSARLFNTSGDPTFIVETDSTGDTKLQFLLSGVRAWEIGIDNSDSDKLKLSPSAGLTGASLTIETDGDVGIGTQSPAAQLHLDQSSTSGAQPVITLDQADVDEDFFKFIGTSDTNVDRALVDAVDFTTPGTITGWLKINIQDDQSTNPITDSDYYLPFYTAPTA